jgi:hypothetical protein
MSKKSEPWTLESLVDLEQAIAVTDTTPHSVRHSVSAAIRGISGAAARMEGLRVWLAGMGNGGTGKKFVSALSMVTAGLSTFTFLAGISAVVGLMDHERGGINVTLFLAILIGGQWLVLIFATLAWLFRRRAAEGFSAVQSLAGTIARRISGSGDESWWRGIMDSGTEARSAMLWRLARLVQTAGIFFNVGIVLGLAGLVMVKHVGFFWETTTELAMKSGLQRTVEFLSAPWSAWFTAAVPDSAVIGSTRWLPGRTTELEPGPAAWWEFLLMATLVWGLLPRLILWCLAWQAGRKSLDSLDFQGKKHRALWRDITGTDRLDSHEEALDGVLVLDVGGCGLSESSLRPFLLRRLRVHPAAWKSVAVLSPGAEKQAAAALANAPAGIVLLAEGWALSPPRMIALHSKIRASSPPDKPVKFLVANVGPDQEPAPPTPDEAREWAKFVDSLSDPEAEIYFYETLQAGL